MKKINSRLSPYSCVQHNHLSSLTVCNHRRFLVQTKRDYPVLKLELSAIETNIVELHARLIHLWSYLHLKVNPCLSRDILSYSGGYPHQCGVIFNANTGSDLGAIQHDLESKLVFPDSWRSNFCAQRQESLRVVRRLPSDHRAALPAHCDVGRHLTALNVCCCLAGVFQCLLRREQTLSK